MSAPLNPLNVDLMMSCNPSHEPVRLALSAPALEHVVGQLRPVGAAVGGSNRSALGSSLRHGGALRCAAIGKALHDEAGKLTLQLRGHADTLGISRPYRHQFKVVEVV